MPSFGVFSSVDEGSSINRPHAASVSFLPSKLCTSDRVVQSLPSQPTRAGLPCHFPDGPDGRASLHPPKSFARPRLILSNWPFLAFMDLGMVARSNLCLALSMRVISLGMRRWTPSSLSNLIR